MVTYMYICPTAICAYKCNDIYYNAFIVRDSSLIISFSNNLIFTKCQQKKIIDLRPTKGKNIKSTDKATSYDSDRIKENFP